MNTPNPPSPKFTLDGPDEARTVGRYELTRYQAGELDDDRRQLIADALQQDEVLAQEYAELENEKRAFQVHIPFERFAAGLHARRPPSAHFFDRLKDLRWSFGGLAIASSAAALLLLLPSIDPANKTDGVGVGASSTAGGEKQPDSIRLKGQERIGLFIKEDGQARLGIDGEELHPGDQIQFVVRDDARLSAMVLLGVDGKGVVTIYDARDFRRAVDKGGLTSTVRARPRVLEQSVILDDAMGPERFFVLYADQPSDVLKRKAKQAARLLADTQADLTQVERLDFIDQNIEQSSIHIIKTKP